MRIKRALIFVLWILPIAAVGGWLVSVYQMETLPETVVAEVMAEIGSAMLLNLISAAQAMLYTAVCGFVGYIIADILGLWKPFRLGKRALTATALVVLIGGVVYSADHWTFGAVIEGLQDANRASLSWNVWLASVLYGGVIEEVMLRLFAMSLIALLLWKLFWRRQDKDSIPTVVFMVANILSALLFAAGHLPSSAVLYGGLTPMIVFRSFLLNGGMGMAFGWLYRRYGMAYAMMAHAGVHIVGKTLLILGLSIL